MMARGWQPVLEQNRTKQSRNRMDRRREWREKSGSRSTTFSKNTTNGRSQTTFSCGRKEVQNLSPGDAVRNFNIRSISRISHRSQVVTHRTRSFRADCKAGSATVKQFITNLAVKNCRARQLDLNPQALIRAQVQNSVSDNGV